MDTPGWYFTKALSHRQKVLRLFKRSMRECDNWYMPDILEASYHKRILRARFDMYKNENDTRKSKQLLLDGVRELWEKRHPQPYLAPYDVYGPAYFREPMPSDNVLDYWSYPERAQYPKYFAKREQRKKEVLDHWEEIEKSWKKPVSKAKETKH